MLPTSNVVVDMRHTKLNAEEAAILAGEVEKPSWASRNEGIHERVSFEDTIWGFELAGGAYYKTPLRVVYVKPGSRADQACIKLGDTVLRINDIDTSTLTLQEAHELILESGVHLRIAVTSPDDEEDAYYCYKDPLANDDTIPEDVLRAMEAERIRRAIASATKNNELQWPWVRRKIIIYRESNCFLVPSKYEDKHREKFPELPHIRYMDDISEILNTRRKFDAEKEQEKKEAAEKAKKEAEEAERVKKAAEEAKRLKFEEAERFKRDVEIAKHAREEAEKARQEAEEEARLVAEKAQQEAEQARIEAEKAEEDSIISTELQDKLHNEESEMDRIENESEHVEGEEVVENVDNEDINNNVDDIGQNELSLENNADDLQSEMEISNEIPDAEDILYENEPQHNEDRNENELAEEDILEASSEDKEVDRLENNLTNGVENFDDLLNEEQSTKRDDDNIIDSIISENGQYEETIESTNER